MTREKDRRRWSLRRLAVTAAVVALCALLAGCGGGDTGDKISAPFESGKCKGMELEVVKSQLAEAGFTNIQEKPQETATEFLADSVISVKIGSNTSWNSANTWKPDTKIIIEYYAYTGIRHIDVTMDIVARTVTRQGKAVELTPREFDLLEQLMRNRGAALYRDVLYGRVWGGDLLDSRTLDLHIQRLRKKLGWADKIETVYRVGYRLKSDQK